MIFKVVSILFFDKQYKCDVDWDEKERNERADQEELISFRNGRGITSNEDDQE